MLVADGTYTGDGNRDIDFLGKAIVVKSEHGPENCIVDCGGAGRGFAFWSGEDSASVLQGFRIRSGAATFGGGILCQEASPTIIDNRITGNTASWGGGIYSDYSSPVIRNNWISGNSIQYDGGGIYCSGESQPLIENNIVVGNEAGLGFWGGLGGGIFCEGLSETTITGNVIMHNTVGLSGGENHGYGGGIACEFGDYGIERFISISDNVIIGNAAPEGLGGGIYFDFYYSPIISRNIITGNSANYGGGICGYSRSHPIINGNTITLNTAHLSGGGFYSGSFIHTSVINSILRANSAPTGSNLYLDESTISISYSDVEGGWPGIGNIDSDPLLVLPEKRDFRLLWSSPCIDAGHPDSLDADGTRRDMGAHFFDQDDYLTLYLTPDTTETSRGGQLGVTYTAINRWPQPETFWHLTQVVTPESDTLTVFGPDRYTLSGWKYSCTQCHQGTGYTGRIHKVHHIPRSAPLGLYEYRSLIGAPPGMLYDEDRFTFKVIE